MASVMKIFDNIDTLGEVSSVINGNYDYHKLSDDGKFLLFFDTSDTQIQKTIVDDISNTHILKMLLNHNIDDDIRNMILSKLKHAKE